MCEVTFARESDIFPWYIESFVDEEAFQQGGGKGHASIFDVELPQDSLTFCVANECQSFSRLLSMLVTMFPFNLIRCQLIHRVC